ncbi:hypothetical protein AB4305_22740 [Nocardia sp. 2YAB30]|uniref:hypothetical protein n=1 Tax=unclassified Nocardia TaxID=2637762 RepID=UPI003F9E73AF
MNSKPISAATTLLIPLLFVLGVASAPPAAAEPLVAQPEPVLGVCTGSVCVPPLAELLRRAPLPLRLSDQRRGDVGCSETLTLNSAGPRPFEPKTALGACTGSACLPPLTQLLRRAPLPLRQSDQRFADGDHPETLTLNSAGLRPSATVPTAADIPLRLG